MAAASEECRIVSGGSISHAGAGVESRRFERMLDGSEETCALDARRFAIVLSTSGGGDNDRLYSWRFSSSMYQFPG
jgi:hypothetical protein